MFPVSCENPMCGWSCMELPETESPNARVLRSSILRNNGKLYRPSQDCSKHYGYSVTFNEIIVLDRNRYQEIPCATITPPNGRIVAFVPAVA